MGLVQMARAQEQLAQQPIPQARFTSVKPSVTGCCLPSISPRLTLRRRLVLQGQARWLTANPDYTITIEGHADEQGTREYNLALGARRANAAREYLISQGIAGSRIQVVTYGKERPIEICSAEACYSQNRRAVTVLAGGLVG